MGKLRISQRNIELVWLTGRLIPDFKTTADLRKNNGTAVREVRRDSPRHAQLPCDNGLVAGAGLRSYASMLERNLQGGFYASDNAGGCTLLFSADCLCTD